MGSGAIMFCVLVAKIGATLLLSTGITTGIKFFNTYDFKAKKKGGFKGGSDDLDYLREKVRPRD